MFAFQYVKANSNEISEEIHFFLLFRRKMLLSAFLLRFIKHLMTGPEGNSKVCFPKTSMFAEGNIEGRGETKLTVSRGVSY